MTAPAVAQSVAAEDVARLLRVVADELEHDAALAQRVAAALRPMEFPTAGAGQGVADTPLAPAEGDEAGAARPRAKAPARTFRPRIIEGTAPEVGTGVPDPFALQVKLGTAGLRAALDEMRLGSLRAIVRAHKLDGGTQATKQNDAQKLRELILAAVAGLTP